MQLVPQAPAFPQPPPELELAGAAEIRPFPTTPDTPRRRRLRGRYEIEDVIGRGGFAVVCKGYDAIIGRTVAIKICCRQDRDSRARFLREAAIGRFLDHHRLTRVHDFGSDGPTLYAVQEYLSGEDLGDMISRRRPRSLADRLEILVQVASGLAHAHSKGILHRDVKPANIRVLDDGCVKIMDFGSATRPDVDDTLTEVGTILGTLAYLPPEVLMGRAPRASSDVYSFGVLAYELLSFRRPFAAPTFNGLIHQIQTGSPTPLTRWLPDCPAALAETILRCLSKGPEDRPPGFAELELDLRRVQSRPLGALQNREVACVEDCASWSASR